MKSFLEDNLDTENLGFADAVKLIGFARTGLVTLSLSLSLTFLGIQSGSKKSTDSHFLSSLAEWLRCFENIWLKYFW